MSRWTVGIDLGTTHSALAESNGAELRVLPLPQLVEARTQAALPLLPSFIYFPPPGEGPYALPWDSAREFAVGHYARDRGAHAPGRVLASAKSWLSSVTLDRRAPTLPLEAAEGVEPISPVEASFRYLEHLSEAWSAAHPGESLGAQEVVIAVPASFDAAARELTVEAAYAAGFEDITLLEEPQAAVYAWLHQRGARAQEDLRPGDVLLVVDIGGGTTDFSLLAASELDGALQLERLAVGDHILLGGDNMDLALAARVAARLEERGAPLEPSERATLVHACRAAKERLLSGAEDVTQIPVAIAGRGAQLVGGARRDALTLSEVLELVLEGYFPSVPASARPQRRPRSGLLQRGLSYAADPAVTRHLAEFLGRHAQRAGAAAPLWPTCVLLNGGVMKAPRLRERLLQTLNEWLAAAGAPPARLLPGEELDLAVARGAAVFGRLRHGEGFRIRGGSARAYYVGIEEPTPAVPGLEPPVHALCVAPFGMEEGRRVELPPLGLAVVVGEPVRFRFYGSSVRRQDAAGTLLRRWAPEELEELAPVELSLPALGRSAGDEVAVTLHASVTAIGTLALEAVPLEPLSADERFSVELSVRS